MYNKKDRRINGITNQRKEETIKNKIAGPLYRYKRHATLNSSVQSGQSRQSNKREERPMCGYSIQIMGGLLYFSLHAQYLEISSSA